jgi:hypothetical protein
MKKGRKLISIGIVHIYPIAVALFVLNFTTTSYLLIMFSAILLGEGAGTAPSATWPGIQILMTRLLFTCSSAAPSLKTLLTIFF